MTPDQAREVARAMTIGSYGGFAAYIGKAYLVADLGNKEKLLGAFADLFETVLSYIEERA